MRGEQLGLERRVAVALHHERGEGGRDEWREHGVAAELLDDHREVEQRAALAAVILVDREPGPAEVDQRRPERRVRLAGLLDLANAIGGRLARKDVLGVAAQQLLEVCWLQVH